jgi:glycerate kinase
MKVNIYSDKFSGTLTASEVLAEIKTIFRNASIQASYFPVTDGGEDSTEILKHYNIPTQHTIMKKDFVGNWIPAEFLIINKEIYFESAKLIGVNNSSRHPFDLSTVALSQVIDEVDVLSLGGSKTVDGGIGLLSARGVDFYSNEGIISDPKPRDFMDITSVNISDSFKPVELTVLTDTSISLLGNNSAISAYGPQKGLNKKEIKQVEIHLERIFDMLSGELGVHLDPSSENTGAAGGLSFVLGKVLGCNVISGSEYFLKVTNLSSKIQRGEISIVCEGKFDKTSLRGKVIGEILKHVEGEKYFLGGQYDYIDDNDFNGIFECGPKGLTNPKEELRNSARKLVKQISI